jgi:small subunit ribosomal protein S21
LEIRVLSRDIEKALRNLKKKLQLDGLFGELKKRRHYEKPSVKKKNKRLEAEKRRRKHRTVTSGCEEMLSTSLTRKYVRAGNECGPRFISISIVGFKVTYDLMII